MSCESKCGAGSESRGWMRQHEIMPRVVQRPDGTYGLSLGNRGGRTQNTIDTTEPRYWEQKAERQSTVPKGITLVFHSEAAHNESQALIRISFSPTSKSSRSQRCT